MTKETVESTPPLTGEDALSECIRLWRLNDTFKGQIADHGRTSSGSSLRTMDDESCDYFISHSGCGAAICGNGQQRAFLQFMPKGTALLYMREQALTADKELLPHDWSNVAKSRVAEFRRTKNGRAIYDNAPEEAKLFYQRSLGGSEYGEEPVYDHYRIMDNASWDYIIAHAETKHLKSDLVDIREHMQGQPDGTNMFWWRGRHRPKNAASFDENHMRKIIEELALAKMGYDDGRRWFDDDNCRDMTIADMRRSGLKALCLDMPKAGYESRDFFFRSPFWDLHYWDESSRRRLVDTAHKMWAEQRANNQKESCHAEQ